MKNKLILHIGLRKTGSSALQEILAKTSDMLLANGVHYPPRLLDFPAHQELAWCLMNPIPTYSNLTIDKERIYDHYESVIDSNVQENKTTLLSSEDLSFLTFNYSALEYLQQRFLRYDPLIVFYFRSPLEYFISDYKHALTESRENKTFSEYIFDFDKIIYPQPEIYKKIWGSCFSENNIIILKYKKNLIQQNGIFSDFMSKVFEIDLNDEYKNYRSNIGVHNSAIELFRILNKSSLSDEHVSKIKNTIKEVALPSDVKEFLKNNLTHDEIDIIKKIYKIN